MSDRDELARAIDFEVATYRPITTWGVQQEPDFKDLGLTLADGSDMPVNIAKAVFEAGWRKKPSREAVARAVASGLDGWNDYDAASEDYKRELLSGADAVLALMDGPTEKGAGDVG